MQIPISPLDQEKRQKIHNNSSRNGLRLLFFLRTCTNSHSWKVVRFSRGGYVHGIHGLIPGKDVNNISRNVVQLSLYWCPDDGI